MWEKARLGALFLIVLLSAASADAEETFPLSIPESSERLRGDAIQDRMSGSWFSFEGAEGRARGSSIWLAETGHAGGYFQWDGTLQGGWSLPWKIEGDKSCLQTAPDIWICNQIYAYRDGFLEVEEDGTIHTVTLPRPRGLLGPPLSETRGPLLTLAEAGERYLAFMAWAQKAELSLLRAEEIKGMLVLTVLHKDGHQEQVSIDPTTGWMEVQ